jgi:hypothetical protein
VGALTAAKEEDELVVEDGEFVLRILGLEVLPLSGAPLGA